MHLKAFIGSINILTIELWAMIIHNSTRVPPEKAPRASAWNALVKHIDTQVNYKELGNIYVR